MSDKKWGEFYRDSSGNLRKYIPIHQGQKAILESKARQRAIISGISAGKTTCGAMDLANKIKENPKGQFLVVGPTFAILNMGAIPTWEKLVKGTDFEGVFHPGAQKFYYDLPTGGRIWFKSGDNPNSIEAVQVDGSIWVDEAGQCSVKVWHQVLKRSSAYQAPILLTSTPYPEHQWMKTEVFDQWKAGNPNYFVSQFPSCWRPGFSVEEMELKRQQMPEWKWRMFYLGDINVGVTGLVYPELSKCFVDMPEDGLPEGELFGGIDWGGGSNTADPFVSLHGVLDEADCLWVFFERRTKGEENDLLANAKYMRDWNQKLGDAGYHVRNVWADASRPNSIRAFRRLAHMPVRKANNQPGAIATGIDLVTARIRTGRLKIVKDECPGLVHESELYRYPTDDEEEAFGSTPIDKHNHSLDALRYMVMGIDKRLSVTEF